MFSFNELFPTFQQEFQRFKPLDFNKFSKCYVIICKKDILIEQQNYIIRQIPNIQVSKVSYDHGFISNINQAKETFTSELKTFLTCL